MSMSKILGVACLGAAIAGGVTTVEAATCISTSFQTTWTGINLCPAPMFFMGNSKGFGTVNTFTQAIEAHLDASNFGGSSDRAEATGHDVTGAIATGGPSGGACFAVDTNPSVASVGKSANGKCNGPLPAVKHKLSLQF